MSKHLTASPRSSLVEQLSSFSSLLSIWMLHIMVMFIPLFFLVSNEELFEFNKMLATYGSTIIVVAGWIISRIALKRTLWKLTPFDVFLLFFFLSQLASTALSIHPRTSLFGYYTRFHGGLYSTITYIALYYSVVHLIEKKWLMSLVCCILIGATLSSLYAFPEHFGHSPSCVLLTQKFDASCWIQDVQTRVFGTFGQPNWLAAYLITLIPLSAYMALRKYTQPPQISFALNMIAGLVMILMTSVLLFTKSRSGFLGFAVGITAFLTLYFLISWRKRVLYHTAITILSVLLSLVMVLAVFGSPFSPSVSEIIKRTDGTIITSEPAPVALVEIGGTESGDIRRIVWKGAVDVWKRYPLFGSGVETFAYSYYLDRPAEHNLVSEWDFLYNKAHNELLNFLATTGIIGLSAYLLLHTAIVWFLLKESLLSEDIDHQLLSAAVLSGLIALHISNFFGFSTVMVTVLMYTLPALVVSNIIAASHDNQIDWNLFSLKPATTNHSSLIKKNHWLKQLLSYWKQDKSSANISTAQWFAIATVSMIALLLCVNVYSIWHGDFLYAQAKKSYKANQLDTALQQIKVAIDLSPKEALYFELYSKITAQYAIAALEQGDAELGTALANSAIEASQTSLLLNPAHLNFYKSRNQMLLVLAQANTDLYTEALLTLQLAQRLAPTDPKLVYFQGLIEFSMEKYDDAVITLQRSIELKPNYDSARYQLGLAYEQQQQFDLAQQEYSYILEHISPNNAQIQERVDAIASMSGIKK